MSVATAGVSDEGGADLRPLQLLVKLKSDTMLGIGRLLSRGNIGIVLGVHEQECLVEVRFRDIRGIDMVSELALEHAR